MVGNKHIFHSKRLSDSVLTDGGSVLPPPNLTHLLVGTGAAQVEPAAAAVAEPFLSLTGLLPATTAPNTGGSDD